MFLRVGMLGESMLLHEWIEMNKKVSSLLKKKIMTDEQVRMWPFYRELSSLLAGGS